MKLFRTVYQHPVAEAAILGSGAIHGVIGLREMSRRKSSFRGNWYLTLHSWSGAIASFLVAGHVVGLRLLPYLSNKSDLVGFPFISFVLDYFPLFFYPNLAILATASLYHMSYGFLQIISKTRISRGVLWKTMVGLVSGVLLYSVVQAGTLPGRDFGIYPEIMKHHEHHIPSFLLPWK
eukprot:TRINITY_DN5955_c0_g1_i2.p1 TRINITY_DN5955_c0_g1~~TRINITY_DN5955_c0_g1_i2.p1  ORF type:complete len:178 (-),score=13.80 TRINITY_DN5955_c0_g1_i2:31-564(-)